jgi:hypothetical protein
MLIREVTKVSMGGTDSAVQRPAGRRRSIEEGAEMQSRAAAGSRPAAAMLLVALVSWLGEYAHNLYELPQLTTTSPENLWPALVSIVLFLAWWLGPATPAAALPLLAWALLHLVGGGIASVLPLSFLPFYPEQTFDHYAVHLVYGIAQLPLIALTVRQLRRL